MKTPLHQIATDLWVIGYPLKMLGADLRRNVTIIRLSSGKLVIHSTAPFSEEDIAAISALGEPAWLIDTLLRHDTFAVEGRAAFPLALYLAPQEFSKDLPFRTDSLLPAPTEWGQELQIVLIGGAPSFGEHVVFHPASRTLVVADLVFNFGSHEGIWTEVLLKLGAVAGQHSPGMTKPFKSAVEDKSAFEASVSQILTLDFDRLIVGHGDLIATNGKALLQDAISTAGFDLREA